jgi:histidinol dehydrogenase
MRAIRVVGALAGLKPAQRAVLLERGTAGDGAVREQVAKIITQVRRRGDAALRALARKLDGVALESLEIPRDVRRHALDMLEPELARALERARDNIRAAHRAFLPSATEIETEPGVFVGRRLDPLQRVGIYAPGGRAAYPSSVLMGAIPARVAAVEEIVLCTPPGPDGVPSPIVLAAAELGGVDRVFALGGAGAIAAMAYGTDTVPRVDRIVGPGNAYVAAAKLQVSGIVGIDSPAGPSELLVIADESCDPDRIALELLAQAEHDPRACVVAVVLTAALKDALIESLRRAIPRQARQKIIAQALKTNGALLLADSLPEAIAFANQYAPEHLLLAVTEPRKVLRTVRNAGTVFLGDSSSVAFGDYMTGANHVLPTGGLARSYSGLSVLDFMRWTTFQRVEPAAAERLAEDVAILATAEGLPAHAQAARSREAVR